MNRSSFQAFARATREVTEFAIDNPRSSAINVVYMFRENLKQLLKRENGFNEAEWLAACRYTKGEVLPSAKPRELKLTSYLPPDVPIKQLIKGAK